MGAVEILKVMIKRAFCWEANLINNLIDSNNENFKKGKAELLGHQKIRIDASDKAKRRTTTFV